MNIHDIEIKSVSLSFGYKDSRPNDLSIQVEIMDTGKHKSLDLWMTNQEPNYVLKEGIYNQFKSQFEDFFKKIYVECPLDFKSHKEELVGGIKGGIGVDNKLKLEFVYWEGLD